MEEYTEDVKVAFMPPVSYGGLPPRYGVVLQYSWEEKLLSFPVHHSVGPPNVVHGWEADGLNGDVRATLTVDNDRRNDLNAAVRDAVELYVGEVTYDGLTEIDVESYDVIFDPDD